MFRDKKGFGLTTTPYAAVVLAAVVALVLFAATPNVARASSSPWGAAGYLATLTATGGAACSAFVVQGAANQSVIATAGHCVNLGSSEVIRFCPGSWGFTGGWNSCAYGQPMFTATASDVHLGPNYQVGDEAYDFAFVTVHPTGPAGPVAAVVGGGLPIAFNPAYYQPATMYGFAGGSVPMVACGPGNTSTYTPLSGWPNSSDPPAMKLQNNCNFGPGASGGPWVSSWGSVIAITAQQLRDCLYCGFYNTGTYMGGAAQIVFNIASRARYDTLRPGEAMVGGQQLTSANGQYKLVMQGDGNLVVYTASNQPLWSSGTFNHPGAWAVMQGDGNFVVYSASRQPLWSSGTFNHPGAWAVMQGDGNFVVYSASNQPLWWSK